MQTLGLSDSDPRSEGRLKSLFWPSIQSGVDVDYLGAQGYWVCAFVGAISFLGLLLQGQPILGATVLVFFYFGGVGVRERDRFAAVIVFAYYLTDMVISVIFTPSGMGFLRMGVLRVIITGLLLSNLRATWMASLWRLDSSRRLCPLASAKPGRINLWTSGRPSSGPRRGYRITSFPAFFWRSLQSAWP